MHIAGVVGEAELLTSAVYTFYSGFYNAIPVLAMIAFVALLTKTKVMNEPETTVTTSKQNAKPAAKTLTFSSEVMRDSEEKFDIPVSNQIDDAQETDALEAQDDSSEQHETIAVVSRQCINRVILGDANKDTIFEDC